MTEPRHRNLRDRCFHCGTSLPMPTAPGLRKSAFCGDDCWKAHRRRRLSEIGLNLLIATGLLFLVMAALVVDRCQKSRAKTSGSFHSDEGRWTMREGTSFSVTLLRVEGDRAIFLHEGDEVSHQVSDFSDDNQARIRRFVESSE